MLAELVACSGRHASGAVAGDGAQDTPAARTDAPLARATISQARGSLQVWGKAPLTGACRGRLPCVAVLAIDYPLAPDRRFPAAFEATVRALD